MIHPDHDCEDCGLYHTTYSAIETIQEKKQSCGHIRISIRCRDCGKQLTFN